MMVDPEVECLLLVLSWDIYQPEFQQGGSVGDRHWDPSIGPQGQMGPIKILMNILDSSIINYNILSHSVIIFHFPHFMRGYGKIHFIPLNLQWLSKAGIGPTEADYDSD